MAKSRRLIQLERRIAQLETHFLPPIKIRGNYTKKELDNTRAYCILSHAEIEAYLEDVALDKVNSSFSTWVTGGQTKFTPIIFYLACYCDKAPANNATNPINLAHISHNQYLQKIYGNHGIRQNNLDNLFLKIGYHFDSTVASTLDSFGQQRGEIAHTSIKTQQPIDPSTVKSNIALLLTGLNLFDTDFKLYK